MFVHLYCEYAGEQAFRQGVNFIQTRKPFVRERAVLRTAIFPLGRTTFQGWLTSVHQKCQFEVTINRQRNVQGDMHLQVIHA